VAIEPLTRRSVVRGSLVGLVAAVVGFAVARRSPAADPKPTGTAANGYGAPAAGGTPSPGSSSAGTEALVSLDAVPPGGGVVVESAKVVVTRGQGDQVHAFSAVCTHQGCLVNEVSDGKISCPCHGSVFDASTGAVVLGPASQPLPAVAVAVSGGSVVRA
jgi:Rieske Fe-S protein